MPNLAKTVPTKAKKIYTLLKQRKDLSAYDIGDRLNIFPNTVYRAMEPLLKLGLVEKTNEYPAKFKTKTGDEALGLYSSLLQQNFQEIFGIKPSSLPHGLLQLHFVRTRNEI